MSTPATEYELLYFPIRGRAEAIRLMFACAQVPFTDTGVTDWPSLKPSMPFGQLPVLRERTADGEALIPQSGAILRHLARTFDLYGANERQRTRCDVVAEAVGDWRERFTPVLMAGFFNTGPEAIAKYWSELPATLALFERLLGESAASGAGWFVGDRPTYADVLAFDTFDGHLGLRPESLDGAPGLKAFAERFRALPGVAAHLARRR